MKTTYSNPEYLRKQILLQEQVLQVFPPAIPFKVEKGKKKGKKDSDSSTEKSKDHFKKIEVPLDKDNPDSDKTEWAMPTFDTGTPAICALLRRGKELI